MTPRERMVFDALFAVAAASMAARCFVVGDYASGAVLCTFAGIWAGQAWLARPRGRVRLFLELSAESSARVRDAGALACGVAATIDRAVRVYEACEATWHAGGEVILRDADGRERELGPPQ